jgi:hypothetical protein
MFGANETITISEWWDKCNQLDESNKVAAAYRMLLLNIVKPQPIEDFTAAVKFAKGIIESELAADNKTFETIGRINPEAIKILVDSLKNV